MSRPPIDLTRFVPTSASTVLVHGVDRKDQQQILGLLPSATIHSFADIADSIRSGPAEHDHVEVRADLVVIEVQSHVGQARIVEEITEAANLMREGAVILVVTARRRGSARQRRTLEHVFGNSEVVHRAGPAVVFRAVRGSVVRSPSGSRTTETPIVDATLLGSELSFQTGPGLFSKSRIDDGTRLLLKSLPAEPRWRRVLDLGCGYGVIGIAVVSRWPPVRVVMVDIDPRAVKAARANIEINGVDARCVALISDGIASLGNERFDAVLSHLPTHVPKATMRRMIDEARSVLRPGGDLIVVTASAVDLRVHLRSGFDTVRILAESDPGALTSYRVIQASC